VIALLQTGTGALVAVTLLVVERQLERRTLR
jgi:hypothetical protein